ncbi:MAG TPA: hypothetical protein VN278_03980 [Methanosarcina sp.]|nr:hypothetical protein [Methanosarcina sp.]
MGEIIIANEGLERPEDYSSVFQILGRHEIIPKEFGRKIRICGWIQEYSGSHL